jgi:type VI secretion system secreted protein VgrG
MAYTHENLYFSLSTPLGGDTLLLRSFQGEERISGLFRFVLELESETPDVDFSALVGKGVTVTVHLADGSDRSIHGLVGRFVQGGTTVPFTRYYAELRPWLWMLQPILLDDFSIQSYFGNTAFTIGLITSAFYFRHP